MKKLTVIAILFSFLSLNLLADEPDSCTPLLAKRANQLAKKSMFGALLPTVTAGAVGAAGGAAAVILMRHNLPTWLVNILGREVIKKPLLALAPVAGVAALGLSALTFVGYEAVVLTKAIKAGQVLKSVEMAKQGKVKDSWARGLSRALKRKNIRKWDPKKNKVLLGDAINTLDKNGSLCDGTLKKKRIQRRKKKKLRHLVATKTDILKSIAGRPELLLSGGGGVGKFCKCGEDWTNFCPSEQSCLDCCTK